MATGTLVSRILGLVRTSMLSAVVAQSLAADAFTYANTLPNFFFILLSAGVLNAVLIPQITKAMKEGSRGEDFINRLLTAAFAVIIVVTVLTTALSPVLVRALSGLSGSAVHLSILFAYVCMPQIAFYGLYAVLGNVLNARGRFAAFMWTPALANVVQIVGQAVFLILWSKQTDPSLWTPAMVAVLAGSSTLGIVVQGIALIPPLRASGFRYRVRWGLSGMRSISRMTAYTLVSLVVSQAGGLFTSWVLNYVRDRSNQETIASVATSQNAFLIFMLPHSLITVSILTALFPSLSRAWQGTRLREVRSLLIKGMQISSVGIIPASAVVIALAEPIVRTIFVGLSDLEVHNTAVVLSVMMSGTLWFGITTLQQRYCFAAEAGKAYFSYQLIVTGMQIISGFVALWMVPDRYAVVTIAAGQTIGNALAGIVFMVVSHLQLNGVGLAATIRLWVRLSLACIPAMLVSHFIGAYLSKLIHGWIGNALACCLGGLAFVGLFYAFCRFFKIAELDSLLRPVMKKLSRLRRR